MKRCPYCMQNCFGSVCSHCGNNTAAEQHLGHLPIGTVLAGRYEVGVALGQGGFGITYVAWDKQNQVRVAIKEYFPNRCTSKSRRDKTIVTPMNGYEQIYSNGMKNFAYEGQMLGTVAHIPEVVHVFDGFNENNTAYIVMEFIDGENLEKIVKRKGRLSVDEVSKLFSPLIRVMEELHRLNITHRDISPDNIICMPNGTLKLIDFGSARQIENGKSVTVSLKPGFSPAEQYTSQGQGSWTDVYSMAATIYYCVTGKRPVSAPERMEGQDNDPLQLPSSLGVALTAQQEEVLLWGMTLQPKQRPANMTVFARPFCEAFPEPQPDPEPIAEDDDKVITTVGENRPDDKPVKKDDVIVRPEPSKKKKPMVLLAALIVVVVLSAVLLYNLPTILQNMNPVFRQTDNEGLLYEMDRNSMTATVLDSSNMTYGAILTIPNTVEAERYGRVDGTYRVTKIAEGSFKNLYGVQRVVFPKTLETVEDGAFENCNDLQFIHLSSNVTMDSGAFSDGDHPLIWSSSAAVNLPDGFEAYVQGEDTVCGKLSSLIYDEQGLLYGITSNGDAVLMDVPQGLTEFSLNDISGKTLKGMELDALDGLDMPTIHVLSSLFLYPKELYEKAEWDFDDSPNFGLNLAGSWDITLQDVFLLQKNGFEIDSDEMLQRASYDILLKAMESDSDKPLHSFNWADVLDEYTVSYNGGQAMYKSRTLEDAENVLTEMWTEMIDLVLEAEENGEGYTQLAYAAHFDGEVVSLLYVLLN